MIGATAAAPERAAPPTATVMSGRTAATAPPPADDRFRHAGLLVAMVAALCFANALANDFVYDDRPVILKNALVHHVSGIWRAFAHTYWPEQTEAGQYRPLVVATYALDWALARGAAWWFHLVNVAWHAVASWLVWRLLRELLPPAAALAGALVFAVHPLHVEAIANVVGRAELMMTAFALGALLLHRRGSRWALACFALALLSKENGIVLPGLAVAHDLLFGEGGPRRTLRERRGLYAGYVACAAAYLGLLALLFSDGKPLVMPAVTWSTASTSERLLTMAGVVPEYVRLLVAPFSLSAEYQPATIVVASRLTPQGALGIAIVLGAAAAAVACWRRAPVVSLALLWFAVAVSPVSNVLFPSGIVLAERTLYLPSVSAALLLGAGAQYLAGRGRARAAVLLVAALTLAFAARSWTRTPAWRDNKTMVLTLLTEHPESYRSHYWAAHVHAWRKDWAAADREFAIALRIYQGSAVVYYQAAETAIELRDTRRARALLDTALLLKPDYGLALLRSAEVRYALGDYPGAIQGGLRALEVQPDTVRAAYVVEWAAARLRDPAPALRAYRLALARAPLDPGLHRGYAGTLLATGDTARARAHADSAARLAARPAAGGTK